MMMAMITLIMIMLMMTIDKLCADNPSQTHIRIARGKKVGPYKNKWNHHIKLTVKLQKKALAGENSFIRIQ